MNLYKKFGTNVDIADLEIAPGVFFSVKRIGPNNKKYAEILSALRKPHERKINLGTVDGDIWKDILIKAFVKGALISWTGVKDEEDKDITYSEENAVKLLKDLPDLFLALQDEAEKIENFQAEEVEDIAKK